MNSLVDFQSFKTIKELRSFAETQQLLIQKLLDEAATRDSDIVHLKALLVSMSETKSVKIFDSGPTDEELICIEQLALLRSTSASRALVAKEVESFEKLVRTLQSIRKPIKKEEHEAATAPLTKSELKALASATIEEADYNDITT